MTTTVTAASDIPALPHDEAMALASVEYKRLIDAAERLTAAQWAMPTDCAGWDVRSMVGHLLGMMELDADRDELARQVGAAVLRTQSTGELLIDALTAIQVEERAPLGIDELLTALREAAPGALAARSALTSEQRAEPYDPRLPLEGMWTRGYLLDVIHTRDPWMHRVDLARATGTDLVLTPDHDGRIVADVVSDWARRHGQPFTLVLTGPAGGTFLAGHGGERYELDAVEFCRILSGRATGSGLLGERVPF